VIFGASKWKKTNASRRTNDISQWHDRMFVGGIATSVCSP
jgi:hypothetical protein